MLPKYLRAGHLRDADFYSPGSLRPGCASVAAEQHVDPPTIRRHPRWSEGTPSKYTDTPAADIPAVNRAIRQAYQHAPSSDTDSALYTNYDASATLATTRPCSRELVPPLHTFPAAFTFLEDIWLPLLHGLGIRRHADCDTTSQSPHTCRLCPALFATVPTNRPPGRVTRCHFADMFRRYLRAGQVPDAASYTPGSLRSGCASMAAERRVDRSTVHRHLRWSTGMQGAYTDTPAEDIPAVSRAIHHAYQRAPSGNTDSELYTSYNRSTTTSATFATCRACSSSATAHAAAAQPTQPAPVSTAARTATGSASLAAAAPRAPTCPNAQVAMNNWLGPQRCPLSTRARSARHNCRRRAPILRRSRRRPRRACARPPPGARHCAP